MLDMVVSALIWPTTTTTTITTPITTITQCTLNYSTPTIFTSATIMAVVMMANVIVVGVVYLSICLAVWMLVIVVLVKMGGRWWLFFGISFDDGIVVVLSLVTTILRVAVVIRKNLFLCILGGGICGVGSGSDGVKHCCSFFFLAYHPLHPRHHLHYHQHQNHHNHHHHHHKVYTLL